MKFVSKDGSTAGTEITTFDGKPVASVTRAELVADVNNAQWIANLQVLAWLDITVQNQNTHATFDAATQERLQVLPDNALQELAAEILSYLDGADD